MTAEIKELMANTGVRFGTSGVRGLVKNMTDQVCFSYVIAFLQYIDGKGLISASRKIGIAGDLRNSTPRIMNAVAAACQEMGLEPINYGLIPSPALVLFGLKQQMPTIMVTGSHIPDDRNGIKFNTPHGEILKEDEKAIYAQRIDIPLNSFTNDGELKNRNALPLAKSDAEQHYIQRYINFFPQKCLEGLRIGLYEHSSVARDCFKSILEELGADVISLGRTDIFISVDTEAIRPEDVTLAKKWSKEYCLDCIISTDGDGDRPLISDENGIWLRGDIVGILCAQYLNADSIITPVSSNTAVEKSQLFKRVIRTKIGSPYVIEAMLAAQQANDKRTIVGYEANGGFLQQTEINYNGKLLSKLPTRDAVIVPLAVLLLAKEKLLTISELLETLPQRYTYSDRLKDFPAQKSQKLFAKILGSDENINTVKIAELLSQYAAPIGIDTTDGIRISFANDEIVHLRPSGNAPELRCYTESTSPEKASVLCQDVMSFCLG